MIAVNKADGDLKPAAARTCADYAGALRLLRKREQDPGNFPTAMLVSAAAETGLEQAWQSMCDLAKWRQEAGYFQIKRASQARFWFEEDVKQGVLAVLAQSDMQKEIKRMGERVFKGDLFPAAAAAEILEKLSKR